MSAARTPVMTLPQPDSILENSAAATPRAPRRLVLSRRVQTLAVFLAAFAGLAPTTGDLGLTWDEPAYRYSQIMSEQWWRRLFESRSISDVKALVEPNTLLYYWPYARFGRNFHPPLAGQLNLLAYEAFGGWMKDVPARRTASAIEFALTVAILYSFLARRYRFWAGLTAAGALYCMPRVHGDALLACTDMPGLMLWGATALAFWNGLHRPRGEAWRVLVGVLLGLAFVEKMGAVAVLAPLVLWLLFARIPETLRRRGGWADWLDGLVTSLVMLAPLGVAFLEMQRLARLFPPLSRSDLFTNAPASAIPGAILAAPCALWLLRAGLRRLVRGHGVWGVERPALQIWTAILAFAPLVGWLGNPAWWRDTLPRLAHYQIINSGRKGALPDIRILYFGQTYIYSLPWQNAFVLVAITVPVAILVAALIGMLTRLPATLRDKLPLYFVLHMLTLPVVRMFETPAHDGVRLFLPTFFFLAAFAGWGADFCGRSASRLFASGTRTAFCQAIAAIAVLGPAAIQEVDVHPYELSYYNEWIGGPRGAWNAGFELSYWYDAFNPSFVAEVNASLPHGASVDFLNDVANPPTFFELQTLGELRSDIGHGDPDAREFPYVWLLTQDSKASAFTRLLFAMRPRLKLCPPQLDGLRVATVADPEAVSRAWALQLLCDARDLAPPEPLAAPAWVRLYAPFLSRFWGDGASKFRRPSVYEPSFAWARRNPEALRAAARAAARREPAEKNPDARRLLAIMGRFDRDEARAHFTEVLLRNRPEGLLEAVEILIRRPEAVRSVLMRQPYTDPASIGGYLDRDVVEPEGDPVAAEPQPRESSFGPARKLDAAESLSLR